MNNTDVPNSSRSPVYQALSSFLDFSNDEQRLWWHSVAPMFAEMLRMSGYDLHSQYRILGSWKKAVIPFLGVYPRASRKRWLSILTRYGTPFELSLNCSHRLVRYTFEPINAATGTAIDPFNTHAIWDGVQALMPLQHGIDLQCMKHYKAHLTLNEQESVFLLDNNLAGSHIRTQNKLALDLGPDGFVVKVYIYPALKSVATGRSIEDLVFDSIHTLCEQIPSLSAPVATLEEYVQSRGHDGSASVRLLSCDLINPAESRTKVYLLERMVSLDAMENLWTLGGLRQDPSTLAGLGLIRELWDLLQLPTGLLSYPEGYLDLGARPDEQLPLMANYTLRPDDPMPEPQVYFTTFGMNDARVANGLVTFFKRQGWSEMANSYIDSLRSF